jgi:hypothetical protein
MGSPLDPGIPTWPAGSETKSRTTRDHARAREIASADYERDVDAAVCFDEPDVFRPRRGRRWAWTLIDSGRIARCPRCRSWVSSANGFACRRCPPLRLVTRPCRSCGETTSSVTRYFCAGCHFAGWWGRWCGRVSVDA